LVLKQMSMIMSLKGRMPKNLKEVLNWKRLFL
jgi:hypothetical protein